MDRGISLGGIWCAIGALMLSGHGQVASGAARQQAAERLAAGEVVEAKLAGGGSRSYEIQLAEGQFLQLEVIQKGLDVEVTAYSPDGKLLLRIDNPNGTNGPESLVLIAAVSGAYRIEIVSGNKQAPAGILEVRVAALRRASAGDEAHVRAERTFEAGQALRTQRNAESLRAAIAKYEEAEKLFESLGLSYRAAIALYRIGTTCMNLSEFRRAAAFFDRALPIFRELEDVGMQVSTMNSLGGANDVLGEKPVALEYYKRALALASGPSIASTRASIVNNIGKIYNDLADWQKSIEYYSQALPLFRGLGDKRREGIILHNLGVAYVSFGEPARALEYYQQSLPLRRETGDKAGEADTLIEIGGIHASRAEWSRALEFYRQALVLHLGAGNKWGEAYALVSVGRAESNSGDREKGLATLGQALEIFRGLDDPRGEARALGALGNAQAASGAIEKAVECHTRARDIYNRIGDRQSEALALYDLARVERARADLPRALEYIEKSLALTEEVRALTMSDDLRASYLATRQNAYQLQIDMLMQLHMASPGAGHDGRALQASERARARSLLDLISEAGADIRAGVDAKLLEREKSLQQKLNSLGLSLAGRKTPKQAEEIRLQVGRLEEEYRLLQAEIRRTSPRYSAITQPQPLGLDEIRRQVLGDNSLLLEYSLGDERGYLWAVTRETIAAYELPGREAIRAAADKVYGQLTARSARPAGETLRQRNERIQEAEKGLASSAGALAEMVLAPAAAFLGKRDLMIVADGPLLYLPFAMLPVPGKQAYTPLVAEHEIVSLPSASTLAVLRRETAGRRPPPGMIAVIADPVFGRDDERFGAGARRSGSTGTRDIVHGPETGAVTIGRFSIPRLPYTRIEAERITSLLPGSKNFRALDFDASRQTATSGELSRYRYIHFATHGLIDSDHPGLSSLLLSLLDEKGNPRDGFLRVNEIYNLELPAELVVLSACQTGLGREIRGEGFVGLTRGFMYAGAARVMVSLWSVNDRATSELMARFYRKMLREKMRPAAALRSAQLEMLRSTQWKSPFYWAPFVLQGD